jgi:hypothetical protein
MNYGGIIGIIGILVISPSVGTVAAQSAPQKIGIPTGNAVLYFLKSGTRGKEGSAPSLMSWKKYGKVACPEKISSWPPTTPGEFCAANKAAAASGLALASMCDPQYAAQCRLLAGTYASKGVTVKASPNAMFWYFDGKSRYPVEVSATSDRTSTAGYSLTHISVNGAHMHGLGGTAGSSSCVETADEFAYSAPSEVPDIDAAAPSYATIVFRAARGTIYRACAL